MTSGGGGFVILIIGIGLAALLGASLFAHGSNVYSPILNQTKIWQLYGNGGMYNGTMLNASTISLQFKVGALTIGLNSAYYQSYVTQNGSAYILTVTTTTPSIFIKNEGKISQRGNVNYVIGDNLITNHFQSYLQTEHGVQTLLSTNSSAAIVQKGNTVMIIYLTGGLTRSLNQTISAV